MDTTTTPSPVTDYVKPSVYLDRETLLDRRDKGLFGSITDYIALALEIDFPGRLSAQVNPKDVADRWSTPKKPLTQADVLIGLGRLMKKGFFDIPHCQIGVIVTEPDDTEPGA